jgi:hypothetical protein
MNTTFKAMVVYYALAAFVLTGCPLEPDGGGPGNNNNNNGGTGGTGNNGGTGGGTTVNAFDLTGQVIAPVKNAPPDTTEITHTQYTGTVAWQTGNGESHDSSTPFAAGTVYRAVVSLTAKPGWTFTGVGANSFTYTGATVTNAANSGVVTITFPKTAAAVGIPIGNPLVKLYLDGSATPLAHNGSTPITTGAGTFTVSIAAGTYTAIIWHLDNVEITKAAGKTSITLSKQKAGAYLVTVEAQPAEGVKDSGAHTFVVQ